MRVTVLIPVHNKAPFLRECLDSVFAGTFQDLEVVAVDDAHGGSIPQILFQFGRTDHV